MAKIYGLNGIIRGRQGNNVFSVQNGTQVVKQYQPAVANPRTLEQREQRSKFALAGKMSMATPAMAIVGMSGGNMRAKRAKFVSNIIRNSTSVGTSGSLVASIPYASVLYSEGSVGQWRDGMTLTAAWHNGSLGADRITAIFAAGTLLAGAPAGYDELRIVALYDAATSTLEEVQVKPVGTAQSLNFTFRLAGRRDCYVVGYVVPFVRVSETSRPVSSGLYGSESAASLDVSASGLLNGAEFGRSLMVSAVGVLGAQQSNAVPPSDDTRYTTDPDSGEVMKSTKKK